MKLKCTVDHRFDNGIWKIIQNTDTTIKVERVSEPPHCTTMGMGEDAFTAKKDNYASSKPNKYGTRTVARHCFIPTEKGFVLYPDRAGIPFVFDRIEDETK